MAVTVALNTAILPNPLDVTQNSFLTSVTLTLTANYGGAATHGDTVNLSGVCPSDQVPQCISLRESPPAGTAPTGYLFNFCPGTNATNGVLSVLTSEGSEYSEGSAYSAALLAAALTAVFQFPKFT